MKKIVNIVNDKEGTILLRNSDKQNIIIKDFEYYFYISGCYNEEFLKNINKYITFEKINGRCLSIHYEGNKTEIFYRINVLKYEMIDFIIKYCKDNCFTLYEIDINFVNKFLLDKNIKIYQDYNINDIIVYFSIFIENQDNKTNIPRWTENVAQEYNHDISEMLYNSKTNAIYTISALLQEEENLYPFIYIINNFDFDINKNLNEFSKKFTNRKIKKIQIKQFNDELSLINAFLNFIKHINPNFILGWETNKDIYYIRERLAYLSEKPKREEIDKHILYKFYKVFGGNSFENLEKDEIFLNEFYKQILLVHDYKYITNINEWKIELIPSLIHIINLETIWNKKINNNDCKKGISLENVFKYLFDIEIIIPSQNDLKNSCIYQIKKVLLSLLINDKKNFLANILEICKNIPITVNQAIYNGQSCRIKHKIIEYIKEKNIFFKTLKKQDKKDKENFKGGFVLEPSQFGFITIPIIEIDLISCYPSIVIGFNICFSTLVIIINSNDFTKKYLQKYNPKDHTFIKVEEKYYIFEKKHVKIGILPKICEDYLTERYKIKQLKKNTIDKKEYEKLELKEKVLKDFLNSIFGVSSSYLFEHVKIGLIITFLGKYINMYSSDIIKNVLFDNNSIKFPTFKKISIFYSFWEKEEYINKENKNDLIIHYIDTDSIFFRISKILKNSIFISNNIGKEVCKLLNENYKKQFGEETNICIEFKCILIASFWLQKRHYYYIPLLNQINDISNEEVIKNNKLKFESKGSVLVKSNKFLFLKNIVNNIFQKIFTMENIITNGKFMKKIFKEIEIYLLDIIIPSLQESEIKLSEWLISNKVKKDVYIFENRPSHIKMIDYHVIIDKEYYEKPQLDKNIQTLYYKGNSENQIENITHPSFFLKKKLQLNINYSIELCKTDLNLILTTIENTYNIDYFFNDHIFDNNKRKLNKLNLNRIEETNKKCKECIISNKMKIEDVNNCFNYACSIKIDNSYFEYSFN